MQSRPQRAWPPPSAAPRERNPAGRLGGRADCRPPLPREGARKASAQACSRRKLWPVLHSTVTSLPSVLGQESFTISAALLAKSCNLHAILGERTPLMQATGPILGCIIALLKRTTCRNVWSGNPRSGSCAGTAGQEKVIQLDPFNLPRAIAFQPRHERAVMSRIGMRGERQHMQFGVDSFNNLKTSSIEPGFAARLAGLLWHGGCSREMPALPSTHAPPVQMRRRAGQKVLRQPPPG